MPEIRSERAEGYPSLTAREHWRAYAKGMLTEVLFVLGLAAIGLGLAAIAMVIWG